MKERDYIHATTLARLQVIHDTLRSVMPSKLIPEAELDAVKDKIHDWLTEHYDKC